MNETRTKRRNIAAPGRLLRVGARLLAGGVFAWSAYSGFALHLTRSFEQAPPTHLANADALYPVSLAKDLLFSPYDIRGWHVPPSPYWFPDIALQLPIYAATKNTPLALFSHWVGVGALFAFSVFLLIERGRRYGAVELSISSGSALLCLPIIAPDRMTVFVRALTSAHHGWAAVVAWFACAAMLSRRTWPFRIACCVCVLTLASDRYLLVGLVPVAAMGCIGGRWERRLLWRALWLLGAAALGGLLDAKLRAMGFVLFTAPPEAALQSSHWRDLLPPKEIWPLVICVLLSGVFVLRKIRHSRTRTLVGLLSATAVLATGANMLAANLVLIPAPPRYYSLSYFFLAGGLCVEAALLLDSKPYVWILNGLLAGALTVSGPVPGPSAVLGYRPEFTRCLEKLAEERAWKMGLGEYWYARPVRVFTGGLEVNPPYPLMWIGNYFWIWGPQPPATYRFVLLPRLDIDQFRKDYGAPSGEFRCGSVGIYEYDERSDGLIRQTFARTPEEIRLWRKLTGR